MTARSCASPVRRCSGRRRGWPALSDGAPWPSRPGYLRRACALAVSGCGAAGSPHSGHLEPYCRRDFAVLDFAVNDAVLPVVSPGRHHEVTGAVWVGGPTHATSVEGG